MYRLKLDKTFYFTLNRLMEISRFNGFIYYSDLLLIGSIIDQS